VANRRFAGKWRSQAGAWEPKEQAFWVGRAFVPAQVSLFRQAMFGGRGGPPHHLAFHPIRQGQPALPFILTRVAERIA